MSHKTEEEIIAANTERMAMEQESQDFDRAYADNILGILDSVVVQVAEEHEAERKQRAAEWAAAIPAEWTASVEQRVQEEIAEWEAAGQPAVDK